MLEVVSVPNLPYLESNLAVLPHQYPNEVASLKLTEESWWGYRLALPTTDEQLHIASVMDAHDARIRTEEQYHKKFKLQKKGFMHDLLTGKVRVQI